jgi:hypothetical protein
MADSGRLRGWKYDHANANLEVWVDGTNVGTFDDSTGLNVLTGDATVQAGNLDMVAGTLDIQDGGAVTQATNRTTGVTLSNYSGQVTGDDASLAAVTIATHTVTNTLVAATDNVIITKVSGDVDTSAFVSAVASGSFNVSVRNNHASSADTTAFVYNFALIKSAIS